MSVFVRFRGRQRGRALAFVLLKPDAESLGDVALTVTASPSLTMPIRIEQAVGRV